MSYVVLALLSLMWIGFFLPGLLRSRRMASFSSAATYQECLTRISTGHAVTPEQAAAAESYRRRPTSRRVARRRDTLAGLVGGIVAAVILGFALGGAAQWLFVAPTATLATYVVMLRRQVMLEAHSRRLAAAARPPSVVVEPVPVTVTEARPDTEVVPSVARRTTDDLERIAG